MSTDVRPPIEAVHSSLSPRALDRSETARAPDGLDAKVTASTLAAHAVDRAAALLARLLDELDRMRAHSQAGDDLDVAESRLLGEVAAAERALKACSYMAAEVSSDNGGLVEATF